MLVVMPLLAAPPPLVKSSQILYRQWPTHHIYFLLLVYTRSTRKTPLGSSNLVNQVTRSTAAATVGGKKAAIGNTRGSTGRAALPVSPSVGTPVKKKVMPSTNANTATTTPIKSTRSSDKGTATSTPVAAASSLAAVKAGNTPVINTNAPPKTPISKITTTNNNSNIAATPKTPHQILQETKSQFRRCATPKKLVGRVEERKVITNFWKQTVISGKSGSIYISGCPGTGKTALLDEIIRDTSTERKMVRKGGQG